MITRLLFFLLALVAAVLGYLLTEPLLYAAAATLVLFVLILWGVALSNRKKAHTRAQEANQKKQQPADDGFSGIVEIRQKESKGLPPAAPTAHIEVVSEQETMQPVPKASPAPEQPAEPLPPSLPASNGSAASASAEQEPETTTATTVQASMLNQIADDPVRVLKGSEDLNVEVVLPLLVSLRAVLNAHAVCLLKQEDVSLRYHIKAMASLNVYARHHGSFMVKAPLIPVRRSNEAVVVHTVGDDTFSARNLKYYHEPLSIRQVAIAPVPVPSTLIAFYLVADTMDDEAFDRKPLQNTIAQYAQLLGDLLKDEQVAADSSIPSLRPRRDIIEEEMQKARSTASPLALSIVYLNHADQVAEAGGNAVVTAEHALANCLREAAPKGRIERFGELTYGVFYNGDANDVELWAVALQEKQADVSDILAGGLSIGVAMLHEGHTTPEAFRSDAMVALQEAYETGLPTILE